MRAGQYDVILSYKTEYQEKLSRIVWAYILRQLNTTFLLLFLTLTQIFQVALRTATLYVLDKQFDISLLQYEKLYSASFIYWNYRNNYVRDVYLN